MYGTLECPPETCYEVYIDLEYRKKWDGYVKGLDDGFFKQQLCNLTFMTIVLMIIAHRCKDCLITYLELL